MGKTHSFEIGNRVELVAPLWISNGPFPNGSKGTVQEINEWDAVVMFNNKKSVRVDFNNLKHLGE